MMVTMVIQFFPEKCTDCGACDEVFDGIRSLANDDGMIILSVLGEKFLRASQAAHGCLAEALVIE